MQPHSTICVLEVDQADVRPKSEASLARRRRCQFDPWGWNRRNRLAVMVVARRLVAVGEWIPVPAQTQHANVHPAAAADSRHVAAGRAVQQGTALTGEARLGVA